MKTLLLAGAVALGLATAAVASDATKTPPVKDILAKSSPQEWRTPDPENLLYMDLPQGRVIIELAPDFTPLHAANIRTLVREHYFDGLAVIRVQDNFVTQWGDPEEDDKAKMKSLGKAKASLPPEFTRPIDAKLSWTAMCTRRKWVSPTASPLPATRPAARRGWPIAMAR